MTSVASIEHLLKDFDNAEIDRELRKETNGFSVDTNVVLHRVGFNTYGRNSYIGVTTQELKKLFGTVSITIYLFILQEILHNLGHKTDVLIGPLNRNNIRFLIYDGVSMDEGWQTLSRLNPDLARKLKYEVGNGIIDYTDAMLLGFSDTEGIKGLSYDRGVNEVAARYDLNFHDMRERGVLPSVNYPLPNLRVPIVKVNTQGN